jgi:hypothetical protein
MMNHILTHEAATGTKEQICVHVGKPPKCVEGVTVHGYRNRGREHQFFVKDMPMGVVILGHGKGYDTKETPPPSHSFILLALQIERTHYKRMRTIKQLEGVEEPMVEEPRLSATKAECEW